MTLGHMKTPKAALDATVTTIKSEEHFWAYRDELMSSSSLVKESMHFLSASVTLSPNQNQPIPLPKKCSKSWCYNMLCSTMRLEIGSGSKISPTRPTRPSSLTVNYWSSTVSSIKRPKRGVMLTWPPLLLHPPHPHIWMPCPCHIIITVRSVVIPILTPSTCLLLAARGRPLKLWPSRTPSW